MSSQNLNWTWPEEHADAGTELYQRVVGTWCDPDIAWAGEGEPGTPATLPFGLYTDNLDFGPEW